MITHKQPAQQGFTLIEVLLVLVMMAVFSAMVVPSFFQATGASLEGESRYLQKILRLTAEDAQLTGQLERCLVYTDHLAFEILAANGSWKPLQDEIFHQQFPKSPVSIKHAHLNGDVESMMDTHLADSKSPPMASFYFWPDGRVSNGEITLSISDSDLFKVVHLSSGPAGIYVEEKQP